ncbi:E3 ubiquitin-protein ligase ATL42 [Platanthera zijinensis]|uniref:RING-type E3 ubiquitin transferase n=1 Tax=Platanthera zijinensis TaxID=2320716 RepID=A0AAP0FRR7_9ASPA
MVPPTQKTVFNHYKRLPNLHSANSRTFHEQYRYPLSAVGSSRSLPAPSQNVPYCYDQPAYWNGANSVYPQAENGRVAFKRKPTTAYPAYQNDHRYSPAWSSTTFPDTRNNLQLNSNLQRNVRSRHDGSFHHSEWQSSSSNPPHQLYSMNNFWGHPLPHGTHAQWIHPIGTGFSSYVMNQPVTGNVVVGGIMRNHGDIQSSLSPASHVSLSKRAVAGPSRCSHRQIPLRNSSGYPSMHVPTAAFDNSAPFGVGSVALPRNPRALNCNGGLQIYDEAGPSFNKENVSDVINVPTYFDTVDSFDEYRNMRLDIDDMSYEELLELEETIGNVNTGLSEDHIPSCLTVSVHCSSTQSHEDLGEAGCSICLEEYKGGDNLGTLKCRHAYHLSCVKDWLRIKNKCPICKTSALDDEDDDGDDEDDILNNN